MATTVKAKREMFELIEKFKGTRKAWPKKSMRGMLGKISMKQIMEGLRDEKDRI